MLNPTLLLATVSIGIAGYMALLLAPEPVSKGVATAFTVIMWAYLGWEFFDLLRAYAQLYEDAPRASTFVELREIGERFSRVIGPNCVRILVMVGTAAIGETVALASKAPKLPGFGQASRAAEASTRVHLLDSATGAERVIASVPENTVRVVLPRHVVAMASRSGSGGRIAASGGEILSNVHRAFKSFRAFKRFMGRAGNGKAWHHIVEQRNTNRFGAEAIHNAENIIALDSELHARISAFYSSIRPRITHSETLTVRQWLSTQAYEAQRQFGLLAIENVRKGIWG
ncbi:hypothetical protein DAT35_30850 [Vitiosangium sp. GDMCC 1.1324]|nr:hypothetical protein DAT35_30850 [Vitiosangium sp. GDMCC 1.1324]